MSALYVCCRCAVRSMLLVVVCSPLDTQPLEEEANAGGPGAGGVSRRFRFRTMDGPATLAWLTHTAPCTKLRLFASFIHPARPHTEQGCGFRRNEASLCLSRNGPYLALAAARKSPGPFAPKTKPSCVADVSVRTLEPRTTQGRVETNVEMPIFGISRSREQTMQC